MYNKNQHLIRDSPIKKNKNSSKERLSPEYRKFMNKLDSKNQDLVKKINIIDKNNEKNSHEIKLLKITNVKLLDQKRKIEEQLLASKS